MQITDPVADMLTRIRNANSAKHDTVDVPASNLKKAIAQILLDEGYIKAFSLVDNGNQGVIHITLKYLAKKQPALSGLKRVSKPGLRLSAGLLLSALLIVRFTGKQRGEGGGKAPRSANE